jgi:MscS family membrane protein
MDLLTRVCRSALTALLLGVLTHSVAAQIPGIERPKTSTPAPQEQVEDSLGRTTPRGTIVAFIRAVDRDDFVSAAQYLQVTDSQRRNTEALARDMKALMDRYFSQTLTTVSDAPTGALDDGLPIDRERVGPLTIGERKIDVTLVRITDPQAGPIWLISSETLDQVPALRGSIAPTWTERVMPESLVSRELFGVSLAHWIVLAATLVIPFILLALISGVFIVLARRIVSDPARRRDLDAWYAGIRWPLIAVLTLTIQLMSMPSLGFPLAFRVAYGRVALVLAVVAFAWLMRRLLTLGFVRARGMVWGKHRTSTQSLMLLGERLAKALVVLLAILAILIIVGVDTKTALAGLGIVGVALALGAQKTVENLLGGIFLLSDKALAVGDLCKISDRLGVVEDVTLRSVRLRTPDQSLVSVPAGALAQTGIENFATREKILAQGALRLRYGTSVEQLRRILDGIRDLLEESSKIERGTSHIRLVKFGAEAIELELFAYVLTAANPEFLAVREDLLLRIAAVVEAEGSGFAIPTQFLYMDERQGDEASVRMAADRDSGARSDVRLAPSIADPAAEKKAIAGKPKS